MDAIDSKEPAAGADKPPVPKGLWGTILTTTPIVLTVLATAFAGLSSSEMTQSMYYRSLAAQHQSKAGDQWAFFQAKRTRGTSLEASKVLLQSLTHPDDFNLAQVDDACKQIIQELEKSGDKGAPEAAVKIKEVRAKLATVSGKLLASDHALQPDELYLTSSNLPEVEMRPLEGKVVTNDIQAVLDAIRQRKTEADTAALVAKVNPKDIEAATRVAEEEADRFDQKCRYGTDLARQLRPLYADLVAAVQPLRSSAPSAVALADRLNNSFQAAVFNFDARRYAAESNLNRRTAELYEVRVRRSGVESDRHRERSKHFFYSMLIAQGGVTLASLALARAHHSLFWLVAALAGLVALGFSVYVYLLF